MLSCVRLFATSGTVACQAPVSMEYSRQEYWTGLPFPSPGDLLHPGIEPASFVLLHWQADSLPLCHLESLLSLSILICSRVLSFIHCFSPLLCSSGWSHPYLWFNYHLCTDDFQLYNFNTVFSLKLQPCVSDLLLTFPFECSTQTSDQHIQNRVTFYPYKWSLLPVFIFYLSWCPYHSPSYSSSSWESSSLTLPSPWSSPFSQLLSLTFSIFTFNISILPFQYFLIMSCLFLSLTTQV